MLATCFATASFVFAESMRQTAIGPSRPTVTGAMPCKHSGMSFVLAESMLPPFIGHRVTLH